ncbi:MAG TPA: 4Fe-4S dicluster domain-containing protein, partial [Mycobacteriales bacterium]
MSAVAAAPTAVLDRDGLGALLDRLRSDGYELVGPAVRDGVIAFGPIDGIGDLPAGVGDEQSPGRYRLVDRDDDALFGYAVGPHSPKNHLFPSRRRLWTADRDGAGQLTYAPEPAPPRRLALVGVRGCELAAIAVQDRVLLRGHTADAVYEARRGEVFVLAVNCGTPSGLCFCVSMGTGPAAGPGYDLALTELLDGGRHEFTVAVGTDRGATVLAAVPHRPAGDPDAAAAAAVVASAAASMGRELDTAGLPDLLAGNLEHPRWDDVADRCLTCGNCTMACPTCFCTTVEDVTDLTGEHAERWQHWDSCFTLDFTHLHGGGPARASGRSRYRQWMTHKLSTWWDQFGSSGCVGCGRCIAWCPVGID